MTLLQVWAMSLFETIKQQVKDLRDFCFLNNEDNTQEKQDPEKPLENFLIDSAEKLLSKIDLEQPRTANESDFFIESLNLTLKESDTLISRIRNSMLFRSFGYDIGQTKQAHTAGNIVLTDLQTSLIQTLYDELNSFYDDEQKIHTLEEQKTFLLKVKPLIDELITETRLWL